MQPHIGRYTTGLWTKRYLREQLLVGVGQCRERRGGDVRRSKGAVTGD
jgi:hypothetical protein